VFISYLQLHSISADEHDPRFRFKFPTLTKTWSIHQRSGHVVTRSWSADSEAHARFVPLRAVAFRRRNVCPAWPPPAAH